LAFPIASFRIAKSFEVIAPSFSSLLHAGEKQPAEVLHLDSSSLNEVFRTMLNYHYPAKRRARKKYNPKQ